jgi:hypothetical protein
MQQQMAELFGADERTVRRTFEALGEELGGELPAGERTHTTRSTRYGDGRLSRLDPRRLAGGVRARDRLPGEVRCRGREDLVPEDRRIERIRWVAGLPDAQ